MIEQIGRAALGQRCASGRAKQACFDHHTTIVDASAAIDPAGAEHAMRRHVVSPQTNLIQATEGEARAAE